MGYIHQVCTWPHNSTYATRCTIRCVIMLKKDGGNSFSKRQSVMGCFLFQNSHHIGINSFYTKSLKHPAHMNDSKSKTPRHEGTYVKR